MYLSLAILILLKLKNPTYQGIVIFNGASIYYL